MSPVDGKDAVQSVSDLDITERRAASAGDRHRVPASAVNRGGPNPFQREPVSLHRDGPGTHTGKANRLIRTGVSDRVREGSVPAIEYVVVCRDTRASQSDARENQHERE